MKSEKELLNILQEIIDEYAIGKIRIENLNPEIKNYHEELKNIVKSYSLDNPRKKILEYAELKIKSDYIKKNSDSDLYVKDIEQFMVENYQEEFYEKVNDSLNYHQQYGSFDQYPEI